MFPHFPLSQKPFYPGNYEESFCFCTRFFTVSIEIPGVVITKIQLLRSVATEIISKHKASYYIKNSVNIYQIMNIIFASYCITLNTDQKLYHYVQVIKYPWFLINF
jgi:hypothetical protein